MGTNHTDHTDHVKPAKKIWMSLEQAQSPEEFQKNIPGEFTSSPIREGAENEGLARRDFMKLMGASAMMASLAGCSRRPVQNIVPYVNNPEEIIPGMPNFYASSDSSTGYGLLIKTREGRPIKVDGNVDHPMNCGALSARGQAMIHDLYDPDRLRAPLMKGAETNWADFDEAMKSVLAESKGSTWILTNTVHSPTLKRLIEKSGYHHVMVDSLPMDDVVEGQGQSYGTKIFPRYRFDKADYIVSFDADFLDNWGSTVEYTHQFAERRRLEGTKVSMSKLVVFESMMRLTGQNSDERYAVHPSDQPLIALALVHEVNRLLGKSNDALSGFDAKTISQRTGIKLEAIAEIAKELTKYQGRSLLVGSARGSNGVALQLALNYLNSVLGNEGETVDGSALPSNQFQGSFSEMDRLVNAIRSGGVKTLIVQGVNPAYFCADTLGVKEALKKVPNLVYVGAYRDETAELAKFVAAESHPFECWGDSNPQRELFGIGQPTIRPLWQTRCFVDLLALWTAGKAPTTDGFESVNETFIELHKRHGAGKSYQDWLDDLLMQGFLDAQGDRKNASAPKRTLRQETLSAAAGAARKLEKKSGELVLVLTTSVALGDGSQANNAILQELPDPVSKNTWGNYLAVAPETAAKNQWKDGDILKLENASGSVEIPMYAQPGLHPDVVSTHLGYGRKFNGRIGNGVGVSLVGFTATSSSPIPSNLVTGIRITKTGGFDKIPCTQGHHTLEGRAIAFDTSLEEYRENPKAGIEVESIEGKSLWSKHPYLGYKWGMVIDMNSCTGCSACVIACSVENNVPAVGKDQVQKGREMQWIRIDRYYTGDVNDPEVIQQPMLCQHCDNAPCETVCPVLATTHSSEGINQMTYNRCVGTKYCSNNCPYKVRRFNWFENNAPMNAPMEHPVALGKNPEVTLRSRGVMEKCTFCIQRIEYGKSAAKSDGRRVTDQDVRTACQEACPADAITFGDVNNPESKVAKLKKHPRGYKVLEELNVAPAVTYLTKVRNRPAREAEAGEGHGKKTEEKHHS